MRRWEAGAAREAMDSGGAIYAAGGTVTMRNDTVTTNSAQGGAGSSSGLGEGGGLYITSKTARVCLDVFTSAHVTNNTASTQDANIHGPWTPC